MVLKKYRMPLLMIGLLTVLYVINNELAVKAVNISSGALIEMMSFIPPVFILLGLLDVWIPRETMIKYLGDHSGLKGIIIAFIMGSAAAGPLYGAFPIAAVLMRKGAKFSNVLIFIGAWSTTKIPMFMFEINALGPRFALTRLIVDVIGIIIIASIIQRIIKKEDIKKLYERAKDL